MTTDVPNAIIISDGGLPALIASAIEAERAIAGGSGGGPASLMPWPASPALTSAQFTAVTSQARFLRLSVTEAPRVGVGGEDGSSSLTDTLALLAAVEVARAAGCSRVVWPVQYHADHDSLPDNLDRIAAAVDRALLVTRLGMLDAVYPDVEVTIETPLVDLTDNQVADLAIDLDAPAYLCWWWRRLGEPHTEGLAAAERAVWLKALREAGWVQTVPGVELSPLPEPVIKPE